MTHLDTNHPKEILIQHSYEQNKILSRRRCWKRPQSRYDEHENEDLEQEDLEPPLLDPMWGLNFTETTRSKRSSQEEENSRNEIETEKKDQTGSKSQCMLGAWRCLSGVLETGVMHIERPGGLMG